MRPSPEGLSDFAAKWLQRTAQGFNPGSGGSKSALKVAPDVRRGGGITRQQPKGVPRPPLSGRIRATHNPGLKPWAVLCSRFAAKVQNVS